MSTTKLLALAGGAALTSFAFAQPAPHTLPSGGSVAAGIAAISTPAAGTMHINQSTQNAVIDWNSFSIGSSASVTFIQPNASSVALNRVVGGNPSEIFGRLTANGHIYLTNSNGVLFAPGASVEAGALVATSLSITNQDFLAGRYVFFRNGVAGDVVNQGRIVTPNGFTALAAPRVRNDGVIVARLGSVALAAGDRVSVDIIGDGLINIAVQQGALNAEIVHTGTIEADGGRILLTVRGAGNLLDGVVNSTGILRADSLVERNGEIILSGDSINLGNPTVSHWSGTANLTGGTVTSDAHVTVASEGGSNFVVVSPAPVVVTSDQGTNVPDSAGRLAVGVAQASIPEVATPDYRGDITGILSGPIGLMPPMEHQVHGTGISVPKAVPQP